MKRDLRWWALALLVAGSVGMVGCSQKKSETAATPSASKTETPAARAPAGQEAEGGEGGEAVTPAGTPAGIWTQIQGERQKLATAIQNGELKSVHHLAFAIRDLVVALAAKSRTLSPTDALKLQGLTADVKASADKLDELGDAGNLTGTQEAFAQLGARLDAIQGIVQPR